MLLMLAGCLPASVDELYSLPRMSEEYVQLQDLIAGQLESGGSYAAPTGGSNRQSVQLRDLDGDGTAEALAFLADEDRSPMICVYRRGEDGNFYQYVTIMAEGSSVYSVDYADLNGDGSAELIVSWQIGGDLRQLSVYSLRGADPDQQQKLRLLSADCSQFVVYDLNGDGVEDLLDLRLGAGMDGSLVMYELDDGEPASVSAELSSGASAIRRTVTGALADGTAALFVECDMGNQGLVTDVFVMEGGRLQNITMSSSLGRSGLLRPDGLFAADLNGDGALELPAGSGEFITWYSLDATGDMTPAATTYLNAEDGWYLAMPEGLSHGVTAERHGAGGEERAVVFLQEGDESAPQRSVLVIYTLTGANRLDRAEVDSRFILRQDEDAVYAAQILTDELSQEDIENNFYILYDQWQTGDL